MLKTTPLIEEHQKLGAKLFAFHGWKLPLEYSGSRQEHLNVRKHVGIFDVSHMGEIRIRGNKALQAIEKLFTNNATVLKKHQAQYTLLCNEEGDILDDLILYCLKPQTDYLLCVNAARCLFDLNWISKHNPFKDVLIQNESDLWAQIALQGPKSSQLLSQVLNQNTLQNMKKFAFDFFPFNGEQILVSTTGYTGEKGFEILTSKATAPLLWRKILKQGQDSCCLPIGLAARDTLRIEMKYPLYGNDLSEKWDPFSAGLGWAVKNPGKFIGSSALKIKQQKITQKWIGFKLLQTEGVPRRGQGIYMDGEQIGEVTSGTKSPCLNRMIGMGYVNRKYSTPGQMLHIDIHQNLIPAEIVATPFIKK